MKHVSIFIVTLRLLKQKWFLVGTFQIKYDFFSNKSGNIEQGRRQTVFFIFGDSKICRFEDIYQLLTNFRSLAAGLPYTILKLRFWAFFWYMAHLRLVTGSWLKFNLKNGMTGKNCHISWQASQTFLGLKMTPNANFQSKMMPTYHINQYFFPLPKHLCVIMIN